MRYLAMDGSGHCYMFQCKDSVRRFLGVSEEKLDRLIETGEPVCGGWCVDEMVKMRGLVRSEPPVAKAFRLFDQGYAVRYVADECEIGYGEAHRYHHQWNRMMAAGRRAR